MITIKRFITTSALDWSEIEIHDANSLAGFILRYIDKENKLRDAQVEALKVYLWLKCYANNDSLVDIVEKHYSDREGNPLRTVLFDIASETESENLKKYARTASHDAIKAFLTDFFGGYDHTTTILFSLPMGAGKTYLMAAMIYIDHYFNLTNEDTRFAKNYLIFAPSGLKSSVIPSLRSIEHFDPTWILPEDIVRQIKKQLKFVVLDVNKTEKKSNRIENPNARKVQECLTQLDPSGYIFVTNAEKVILDKIVEDPYKHMLFELTEDEKSKQANELRHLLGKVPSLTILMDEVHHNQKEENKLRLVISEHFNKGNIVSIVGFTGTPYFKRKITVQNTTIQLDQIPNTVYHYELKNGVRNFLKQPLIKSFTSDTETIVRAGLEDFYQRYYALTYKDGRKPKLALYCATIEKLEEQVLPIIIDFYHQKGLDTQEILKYYGSGVKTESGKAYSPEKDAATEFRKLDTPYSNKRIILLCQIGKEGWDCQSLTGVILSGEGDSPQNMVLQTACRCLREVDDAKTEIGLIYLNQDNYKHLERELLDTHNLSIKEFEEGKKEIEFLKRIDRRAHLKLPEITYNQLQVLYEYTMQDKEQKPQEQLAELLHHIKNKELPYYVPQIATTRSTFENNDTSDTSATSLRLLRTHFTFPEFIHAILKSSFGTISSSQLNANRSELHALYTQITQDATYREGFDLPSIITMIHRDFIPGLFVTIREKIDTRTVSWLISDLNKNALSDKAKLYPDNIDFITKVHEYDAKKITPEELTRQEDAKILQLEATKQLMSGNAELVNTLDEQIRKIQYSKLPIKNKDKSFQYLPYDFTQSNFEREILEQIFQLDAFKQKALEVYFNGDRFLSTFTIKIYKKIGHQWKLAQNKYTPDFLIIQRGKKNTIIKALIIETKGAHLAQDYRVIREYMEHKFKEINPKRFEYLYLEDGHDMDYHLEKIHDKIQRYFE